MFLNGWRKFLRGAISVGSRAFRGCRHKKRYTSYRPGLEALEGRVVPSAAAADQYIESLYTQILGRSGSSTEVDGWVSYLNRPGQSQLTVANAIEQSWEGRTRLVQEWYVSYLGRQPANGEEQGWVNMLLEGASEDQLQAKIIASPEFAAHANSLFGTADPSGNYVQALYRDVLGRVPTAEEVNSWLPSLLESSGREGRASPSADATQRGKIVLAEAFLESTEFRDVAISADYADILHRQGSPAELKAWEASGRDLQTIRLLFESSPEFYQNSSLPNQLTLTPTTPLDALSLAEANNGFATDLYQQLDQADGNLLFSPFSISAALAMVYAGAAGQTAAEMAQVLHLPPSDSQMNAVFGNLIDEINTLGQKDGLKLSVADGVWGQQGFGFLPGYLSLLQQDYGAALQQVDFANDVEQARTAINNFVANATNNRIQDLIPAGTLSPSARLVLANAIYLQANWATPFNSAFTNKKDFTVKAGDTVSVDTMHDTGDFNYVDGGNFQMLQLPYVGSDLSMYVLLPKQADGLSTLEQQLSANNIQQWIGEMKPYNVDVSLPKFSFSSSFSLNQVLSSMGMGAAFSQSADFSGITTQQPLQLSAVVHKAFIGVSETGTEAAAATGVVATSSVVTALPPLPSATFQADHPFTFLIRDNQTGTLLFMGRVENPLDS